MLWSLKTPKEAHDVLFLKHIYEDKLLQKIC